MQVKRFKYSLAGAQRLEGYRLDGLGIELTELKSALEGKLREHKELTVAIEAGERAVVALIEQQPMFWVERREAVGMQLSDYRARTVALNDEMDELRRRMTALMTQIMEARGKQRMFEKHSDACRDAFDKQQEKALESWLDEMWLACARREA